MLIKMYNWYYEKKDLKRTPSILNGLDIVKESRYRREGARFIINVGTKMGLRYDTMATGVVYFHRFYMFRSFQQFPRYVTACCCLFLAGKVEETPKKCKDIIKTARTFISESQFAQFGDDPGEEVMTLERILLKTIKFDLQVDHPYGHLLKYAKSLKGDKKKIHNMVQMAWTFINDSLCTTLCLQWEPEVIAVALMYLAGKLSKFEVTDWMCRAPKHKYWWDMFIEGITVELLEDICHQVLDLYSVPLDEKLDSPPATPPTKLTRKMSQPPSPAETSTSPAQIKKEPLVGQPIPSLEPGELKRKVSQTDKEHAPERAKIPRITEGKAIPTISRHSPKSKTSSLMSDTRVPSPPSPAPETIKTIKDLRVSSDPVYKSGLTSNNSSANFVVQNPPFSRVENPSATKVVPQIAAPVASTSFSVSVPPPTATYTQTAPPSYISDAQSFPNIQQPPPQIFPQRPPSQFQHPPPPAPSPALLATPPPHQYPPALPPTVVPPFNTQFPPPRPPSLLPTPPPAPMPQHPSLIGSVPPPLINSVPPPPPPGVSPIRGIYGSATPDMYSSDHRNRYAKDNRDFAALRPRFDGYLGRRDYRRPPPPSAFSQNYERPRPRYLADSPQQKRLPTPTTTSTNQQQPTGIPPVRITGS